jgi:hypothetical protein
VACREVSYSVSEHPVASLRLLCREAQSRQGEIGLLRSELPTADFRDSVHNFRVSRAPESRSLGKCLDDDRTPVTDLAQMWAEEDARDRGVQA